MKSGRSPAICASFLTPAFSRRPWSASSHAWMRVSTRPVVSVESWSRCLTGRPPLPLEQHHTGRDADIQRRHLSRHGNAHQKIAAFGDVFVQAAAFPAQHDGGWTCELHLVVGYFAPLVQAVNPVAALLQVI